MRAQAMQYLEQGWSVIPLQPGGKRPNGPLLPIKFNGGQPVLDERGRPKHTWDVYQSRLPTEEEVCSWWERCPDGNVGIVTGAVSGIVVLDADGEEGLAEVQSHGLPVTPASRTGNGLHLIFRHPGSTVPNFARRAPGLDLRGDGGYIVAPPSLHPNGGRYTWELSPANVALAPIPDWLMEIAHPNIDELAEQWIIQQATRPRKNGRLKAYGAAALNSEIDLLSNALIGGRNNQLNRSAFSLGQLVAGGVLEQQKVETILEAIALATGLTENETVATIKSGLQAGLQKPRQPEV